MDDENSNADEYSIAYEYSIDAEDADEYSIDAENPDEDSIDDENSYADENSGDDSLESCISSAMKRKLREDHNFLDSNKTPFLTDFFMVSHFGDDGEDEDDKVGWIFT